LVSKRRQTARIDGRCFSFLPGETICTEHSHKYDRPQLERMAGAAAFRITGWWTDDASRFAVVEMESGAGPQ
jgi:uncharacterized SAM-dependent methyltransferase